MRRALAPLLLSLTAVVVASACAATGPPPPPPTGANLIGPDVASWQHPGNAAIDWPAVRNSGHTFAFIKATEGTSYTNPYFGGDWGGARNAGLFRGAYHYGHPDSSPIDQANRFADVIGGLGTGDLPPVLDIEHTDGRNTTDMINWVQAFLDQLQWRTGRRPIIYSYRSFFRDALGATTQFGSYPLWVAEYGVGAPQTPAGWSSWSFWQFTSSADVPGIPSTAEDLNRFCCDGGALSGLAR